MPVATDLGGGYNFMHEAAACLTHRPSTVGSMSPTSTPTSFAQVELAAVAAAALAAALVSTSSTNTTTTYCTREEDLLTEAAAVSLAAALPDTVQGFLVLLASSPRARLLTRLADTVLISLRAAIKTARDADDPAVLAPLLAVVTAFSTDEDGVADCGAVGLHSVAAAVLRGKVKPTIAGSTVCMEAAAAVAEAAAAVGTGFPCSAAVWGDDTELLRRPLIMTLRADLGGQGGEVVDDVDGGGGGSAREVVGTSCVLVRQLEHLTVFTGQAVGARSGSMADLGYVMW
jgi:hypothetical protein